LFGENELISVVLPELADFPERVALPDHGSQYAIAI